jgi:hypothetical protein
MRFMIIVKARAASDGGEPADGDIEVSSRKQAVEWASRRPRPGGISIWPVWMVEVDPKIVGT